MRDDTHFRYLEATYVVLAKTRSLECHARTHSLDGSSMLATRIATETTIDTGIQRYATTTIAWSLDEPNKELWYLVLIRQVLS
jgi:hypothetical protein